MGSDAFVLLPVRNNDLANNDRKDALSQLELHQI